MMKELGMNELRKLLLSLSGPFIVIIVLLLVVMGAFGATASEEVSSVKGMLASEEGQRLYSEVWQKPIQDVYEETHISIHIAWVFVPSCMIDDPFVITYERAKAIVMLAMDKQGNEYVEVSLDTFVNRIVEQPEFNQLDKNKIKEIIEKNEESVDTTTVGNIPKDLSIYLRLNRSLPVKDWVSIGEVGMYNPFGEWSMHYGMDIAVVTGTPLYAAADSTVVRVNYSEAGGNTIMLRNGSLIMLYCHMREMSSKEVGEQLKAGDLIGYSGATGKVTGPHLHFETWCYDSDNPSSGYGKQDSIFFNPRLVWDFKK